MSGANPLNIFIVAEQFRYAGKFAILVTTHMAPRYSELAFAADLNNVTASMVCAAFSLELYFKCLIRIGRKKYKREHDLSKLFALIGRRHKTKIRKYFRHNGAEMREYVERSYKGAARPMPGSKVTVDSVLSISRDAFRQMRYIYEQGAAPDTGWLGDVIVEAARQAILDIHPDWEHARQKAPLPETIFRSTPSGVQGLG